MFANKPAAWARNASRRPSDTPAARTSPRHLPLDTAWPQANSPTTAHHRGKPVWPIAVTTRSSGSHAKIAAKIAPETAARTANEAQRGREKPGPVGASLTAAAPARR